MDNEVDYAINAKRSLKKNLIYANVEGNHHFIYNMVGTQKLHNDL